MRLIPIVFLAGCMGPFFRGTYDNRPDDTVVIARVHDDGRIELADGRAVRLFGVRVPAEQLRRFEGKEASVKVLLPTDPPAVELLVWREAGYCGNGMSSWDPFAAPFAGFWGTPVVANAGRYDPIIEADLDHPDAPMRLVVQLRKDATARRAEIARSQAAWKREHGRR